MRALVIAALLAAPTHAYAWPIWTPAELPDEPEEPDPKVEDEPETPVPPADPVPIPKVPDDIQKRLDELEDRTKKLEEDKWTIDDTKTKVDRMAWLQRFITIYLDVGAFVVGGDGSGIRSDFLHRNYPEYRNTISGQWVFMGDPFSTAINTLGEPADTASSREVENDTVNSSGRASLIVNTVGIAIGKNLGGGFSVTSLAQFLPRPGPDILDVPLAHIDYRPSNEIDFVIEVGKVDSVLGVEYRNQDAPRRLGVTPSLICRYTCGRPFGIDARVVKDVDAHKLSASAAILNGNNFDERFEPKTELRSSRYPTLAGHLQWTFPFAHGLEIGVSGAYGPQDRQPNRHVHQWHYGFDLVLRGWRHTSITAEFVQGKQRGKTSGDPEADRMLGIERPSCDVASCLVYKGAYVLVDHRLSHRFTPYVRLDWRDATHRDGANFLYEANSLRATVGANWTVSTRVRAKVEYSKNHEIGVPSFPHDVLTSSVVVVTD